MPILLVALLGVGALLLMKSNTPVVPTTKQGLCVDILSLMTDLATRCGHANDPDYQSLIARLQSACANTSGPVKNQAAVNAFYANCMPFLRSATCDQLFNHAALPPECVDTLTLLSSTPIGYAKSPHYALFNVAATLIQ